MNSPNPARILVVDDDPDILRILTDNLEFDSYRVFPCASGKQALETFQTTAVDLVVLDLTLPDIDGIQVCRRIREKSKAPIIILTARDRVPDKVLGLESGADDYVSKPFDYLELAARIRACLRRGSAPPHVKNTFQINGLSIDTSKNSVSKEGVRINLTVTEFNLLVLLARNKDIVVERGAIRKALWPEGDIYRDSRAIDVHIQHLRSKIEDNPSKPTRIVTIQGVGYMLKPADK